MSEPTLPLLAAAAVLGLVFGSFLNVCIARLPRGESIVSPGSRCPRCGAPVRAWDNVPLISYALLRGRCRGCGERISVRYPLVELAYAALVAGSGLRWGWTLESLSGAVFCFLALGLLMTDWETMLLPDTLTLPGMALGVIAAAFLDPRGALRGATWALGAAAVAGGGVLLIREAYRLVRRREGMGMGDVKLMAMLGVWLGFERTAVAFLVGVVAAAAWGVVLLLRSRGAGSLDRAALRLPLGSFLCGGGLVSLFAGHTLVGWYLGLFP